MARPRQRRWSSLSARPRRRRWSAIRLYFTTLVSNHIPEIQNVYWQVVFLTTIKRFYQFPKFVRYIQFLNFIYSLIDSSQFRRFKAWLFAFYYFTWNYTSTNAPSTVLSSISLYFQVLYLTPPTSVSGVHSDVSISPEKSPKPRLVPLGLSKSINFSRLSPPIRLYFPPLN